MQAKRYFISGATFFFLAIRKYTWLSMSEDAQSRNLKEVIKDVARNERNGLLIFQMGVVLFFGGVIINVLSNNTVATVSGILFVLVGTLSTAIGFYVTVHYAHQYNNLLKELDKLT
jgi:hypothetical protein